MADAPAVKPPPARALFVASIVLLALSGCYPYGRPQPARVPADFPVYSTADPTNEIDGWTSPLPDGSKDRREHFDITWITDASGGDLYSYYKTNLAKGDWVEQATLSNGHGGTIAFNRSSTPTWGGTVYLADHKIHV